jgi:hypothetical protein
MSKGRWALIWLLAWLIAGCCAHPGLFDQVERSLKTVQAFYGPLLEEGAGDREEKLKKAVVAADTTLLLAAELQRQWCLDPQKAEQLELQTQQARNLAKDAGVAAAQSLPTPIPPDPTK